MQTTSVGALVDRAVVSIRSRHTDHATDLLEEALSIDFDDPEVLTILKYINFWRDRLITLQAIDNLFQRGDYILQQWKQFHRFAERLEYRSEEGIFALRHFTFGLAHEYFDLFVKEHDEDNVTLSIRIGQCLKGKGDYERALHQLEHTLRYAHNNALLMAELADCYAMVNEITMAKAFFREAFFVKCQEIDIDGLESELIWRLITKTRETGVDESLVCEWVPVYGALWGVFSVKRELRSVEYGLLRHSIYSLEHEYAIQRSETIVPRLLTRYFWLLDHYAHTRETRPKITEVLLKIRTIAPHIYRLYMD